MSIHDDGLKSKALRFYKEIGYRGIGSLEFKKDERNGEYRLLELNARPWRQNIQTAYANINFALLQYLDLLEKPVEPIWNY